MAGYLEKYSDEELFKLFDANIAEEIKSRGYEYGWHKQINYAGEIYILINPAFPKLVKIGYADNVPKRVKTLNSNSGLPDPYHVYATYKVKKRLEDLKLHKLIDSLDSDLRHTKNKEFYEMSPEKAYAILSAIAEINGDEDLLVLNPYHDDYFTKDEPKSKNKNDDKDDKSEKKKPRKPPVNFAKCGIPVGAELVFIEDPSVVCTVYNDRKVQYNGKITSLSAISDAIKGHSTQGPMYFTYNGKIVAAIAAETQWKDL